MPIPTKQEIVNRKRTAKARKATHENRETLRIAEGRKPDNRATRAARKQVTEQRVGRAKQVRTEVQKQARKGTDLITKLTKEIEQLKIIDPESLLDLVIPDTGKGKAQLIDLMQVLDLRTQGLSNAKIADTLHCTIGRLRGLLRRYDAISLKVQSFKGHRADIFADFQRRILKSITDADLRRSSVGSRLLALCHLYEKERLERDLTTANVVTLHDDIAAIKAAARQPVPAGDAVTMVSPKQLPGPVPAVAGKPDRS